MKQLITTTLLFALLIAIVSCNNNENALEKHKCKIINEETMTTVKKTIYVEMTEEMTEEQLTEVSTYLKNNNSEFEKIFVFYFLPDMDIDEMAWATGHYNPNLNINILGITNSEKEELENLEFPEGEIIGDWYDNSTLAENRIIIFKVDENYKMQTTYKGESSFEKDVKLSIQDGLSRFDYDNNFGEYLLIEEDGDLGQYDADGLFSTAKAK